MSERRKNTSKTTTKPRAKVAHEFVLDELEGVDYRTRPMFGCTAVYVGDRMVLILRDKESAPADNGVWLATTPEHHASLRVEFPHMRPVVMFGAGEHGTQNLPADAPDFEQAARRACELVRERDPRIGRVPGARRKAAAKKVSASRKKASPVKVKPKPAVKRRRTR